MNKFSSTSPCRKMKTEIIDFLGLTSECFNTTASFELLKYFLLCSTLVSIDGCRYVQLEMLGPYGAKYSRMDQVKFVEDSL